MPHTSSSEAAEAFFHDLPSKELTVQEVDLLHSIVKMADALNAVLPRSVSLQEWAQKRVPADLESTINSSGIVYVTPGRLGTPRIPLAGSSGQKVAPSKSPESMPGPSGSSLSAHAAMTSGPRGQTKEKLEYNKFFDSLPTDVLSPPEMALQAMLRGYLRRHHNGSAHVTTIRSCDKQVRTQIDALLPPSVPLEDWVENRLGGDLEVELNLEGDTVIRDPLSCCQKEERDAKRDELSEEFFGGLPADCFTPEENDLRDALVSFITSWDKPGFPTLGIAGGDPAIASARQQCLPRWVVLRDWMERRMGQEIETKMSPNGQYAIGFVGTLDDDRLEKMEHGRKYGTRCKRKFVQ